jgi:hypothetical protein
MASMRQKDVMKQFVQALKDRTPVPVDLLAFLFDEGIRELKPDEIALISRQIACRVPEWAWDDIENNIALYISWISTEGGWRKHLHPKLVDDLLICVKSYIDLPPQVRSAYGLISKEHVEALSSAIKQDKLRRDDLLQIAYDAEAIQKSLGDLACRTDKLNFDIADLNGMPITEKSSAHAGFEQLQVNICGKDIQFAINNEVELSQVSRVEKSMENW